MVGWRSKRGHCVAIVIGWGVLSMPGCGTAPGSSSGLPRDAHVKSLASADQAILCDWVASKFGGYGHRISCPNGNGVIAEMNRMACEQTATSSSCDSTVGQLEDCVNAVAAAPCGGVPPACASMVGC